MTGRMGEASRPLRPTSTGSSYSSGSSGGNGVGGGNSGKGHADICIAEEVKIAVEIALEKFRLQEDQRELEFPSSFTSTERAYIHRLCQTIGLKSKSRGKGSSRVLSISKKDGLDASVSTSIFNLARNSRSQIQSLMQRYNLTSKERQDLMPRVERGHHMEVIKELNKTTTGRLNNGVPQVPPACGPAEVDSATVQSLPISSYRKDIISLIEKNRVVLVSGETGCGKTTQLPQMILDSYNDSNMPCRVFCTQPRRLSALAVAERVAAERGEKIGQTVGYQIRLESKVSPKTLLTFCTNGVLLRTLMGSDSPLSSVTHIIVDEIHERDRFSDFLLIALRDLLPKNPHLRIILMSAGFNTSLFVKYFNGCPLIHIPGQLYPIQSFFLEDVLKITNYKNAKMEKALSAIKTEFDEMKLLSVKYQTDDVTESDVAPDISVETTTELGEEKEELEESVVQEMDQLMMEIWLNGVEELFNRMFALMAKENVSADYTHSTAHVTPLMVAASRGFTAIVEQLLTRGADPRIHATNEWTALDFARRFNRTEVIELLDSHLAVSEGYQKTSELSIALSGPNLTAEDRLLLQSYHQSHDDDRVNIQLVTLCIHQIHVKQPDGAILTFLPGYDDIVATRDALLEVLSKDSKHQIFCLHSSMQSSDQTKVFRVMPAGMRKIVLSTNIAETSITIPDIAYVVDSGKVKEKSFDALLSVSVLKFHWISQASVRQRMGRTGRTRPGTCYHLYSRSRYQNMAEFPSPEILRYPLQEICLHTKLLAPVNTAIADFLTKAPEPPAFLITRNAVHTLKQMDALDQFEDLTELGHHLADLPVEPRYGKIVLYSVVLKCLDPALTVACMLAYRDPFVLPSQPYQKRAAAAAKRKFACGTYSDHMTLLRAFQAWQRARADGWEKQFCEKNFLSAATMEMIVGMRAQLLGQLRASGFVRARGSGDIRDLNSNSENWAVVKAVLCAGMYPNIMKVNRKKMQLVTSKENKVRLHSSSVLSPPHNLVGSNPHAHVVSRLPSDWLVYEEMTRSQYMSAHARCTTCISTVCVGLFAGPSKLSIQNAIVEPDHDHDLPSSWGGLISGDRDMESSDSEDEDRDPVRRATLHLDDWISLQADTEATLLTVQLRQKWHALFIRRMRAPAKSWCQSDEAVVRAVVAVLTNEEQSLGLQQPAGIGQRPKPMSTESLWGTEMGHASSSEGDDEAASSAAWPSTRPSRLAVGGSYRGSRSSDDHSESSSVNSDGLRDSTASSPDSSPLALLANKWPEQMRTNRYFVMKSTSYKNLDISQQRGLWATTTANERKLLKALKDCQAIFIIFSVQGSGHFQGYARVISVGPVERACEFVGTSLTATFNVEWIKRANMPFQHCHGLVNPWNENKKVQISRDGQELEPSVGQVLCKLWDQIPLTHRFPPNMFHHEPMMQSGPRGYHFSGTGSPTQPSWPESMRQHPAAAMYMINHQGMMGGGTPQMGQSSSHQFSQNPGMMAQPDHHVGRSGALPPSMGFPPAHRSHRSQHFQ